MDSFFILDDFSGGLLIKGVYSKFKVINIVLYYKKLMLYIIFKKILKNIKDKAYKKILLKIKFLNIYQL